MSRFVNGELLELLVALIGGVVGSFALRLTRWLGVSDDLAAVGVGVAGGAAAYMTTGPVRAGAAGVAVAGVSDLATRWFAVLERRLGLVPHGEPASASVAKPMPRNWGAVLDERFAARAEAAQEIDPEDRDIDDYDEEAAA